MAIRKLPSGHYKPEVRGSDGRWLPLGTYRTRQEAEVVELKAKTEIKSGRSVTGTAKRLTFDEYFVEWFKSGVSRASESWKNDQVVMYERYVQSLVGHKRLDQILPADIGRVLDAASKMGRAPQTQLHIYSMLHKILGDAVELFEYLSQNPVKRSLRPTVPKKETPYLKVEEAVRLLRYVRGRSFELAVWLTLYVGMRVGEVQALRWNNVDLNEGVIHIRSTYVRKEKRLQDYPKGKQWHSVAIPPELLEMLRLAATVGMNPNDFVVHSPRREMLNYAGYLRALKSYCKEAGVTMIATHGLRHSTSGIYMANGATRDDLYRLFKHSSPSVTERYIHDKGERVQQVAQLIRLFPASDDCKKVELVSG
jgi:integrase